MEGATDGPAPAIRDFQLVKRIGAGAFGEVWLARDVLSQWCAVKIIRRSSFRDSAPYDREFEGIKSYAPLSRVEPSLLRLIHVGREENQGFFYYAMELAEDLDGECVSRPDDYVPKTLRGLISARGRLDFHECLRISRHLATGLVHLHSSGLVHGDIKPSNVIFVRGEAKLADVGLVSRAGLESPITQLGAAGYVAPEGNGTVQADIYSLGIVMFVMLTGRDRLDFPRLPRLRGLSHLERRDFLRLNSLIVRACDIDPSKRFRDATELRDALRFLEDKDTSDRLARFRLGLYALGTTVVVLIGVLVAVVLMNAANELWSRAQRFQGLLAACRENRTGELRYGWSTRVWSNAFLAGKLETSQTLLDEAAFALSGLDASQLDIAKNITTASAAFSEEGDLIASSAGTNRLHLVSRSFIHSSSPLSGQGAVAWNDKGVPIMLMASDHKLEMRNALNGNSEALLTLQNGESPGPDSPTALSSGTRYASVGVSSNHTDGVVVWNTLESIAERIYGIAATALAFSQDESVLGVGTADGAVHIFNLPGLQPTAILRSGARGSRILSLAFARDTLVRYSEVASPTRHRWLLATGNQGGEIAIWDVAAQQPRMFCQGSPHRVEALAFQADGVTLASSGRVEARIWDVPTGKLLLTLDGVGSDSASALAFNHEGTRLAWGVTGAWSPAALSLWDIGSHRGVMRLRGLSAEAQKLWFSPDGQRLAALADNWQLGIWDLANGNLLWRLEVPKGSFTDNAACAFDESNRYLAFVSGREARRYDLASGRTLDSWSLPDGLADSLCYRGLNDILLIRRELGPDGSKPTTWKLRQLLTASPPILLAKQMDEDWRTFDTAFVDEGRAFLIVSAQRQGALREIRSYDVASGVERWRVHSERKDVYMYYLLDPTGSFLAYSRTAADVMDLVDSRNGKTLRILPFIASAISPEARVCAVINRPLNGVRVFEPVPSGLNVNLGIEGKAGPIPCFSRDGTRVAMAATGSFVIVADVRRLKERLATLR